MVSEKSIKKAAHLLANKFHPYRIILFGSYARGTADEHSDVDLLVVTEQAIRKNRIKMMAEMISEIDGLGFPKDVVVITPEEYETDKDIPGTIARYVSKEGRLLYERNRKRGQQEGKRMAAAR